MTVCRDYQAAVSWQERAATGGHLDSVRWLTRSYQNGELGLLSDPQKATQWEQKTRPARF